jgi:adenosylcobyric acid synthase
MARALMFLGTGSDVGKSIVATAFCRIARRRGLKVAPFKAQNMSNNSFVTVEGGEIGRAQVVQAEAAGLLPSVHMNPILLKPSSHRGAQVVLQGKVYGTLSAVNYYELKPRLKDVVMASYGRLSREYDLIVMEGAGSCCEMNLKQTDLVNFAMAREAGAPCILIGDIDRGGVFAQIIGSFHLMTLEEREMTMGFLINKFRGDPALFESGMRYIEEKTDKPGLGLIPFYTDILIDPEDSVAVQEDKRALKPIGPRTVNIAVLKLGAIANFTDMEGLEREKDVVVNYLVSPRDLSPDYDWLILPGTKNTMEDALWVARSGWKREILAFVKGGGKVLGICGGYQLLGETVQDPSGVESENRMVRGLGILPMETVLEGEKIVRKVTGIFLINRKRVSGYEIHMGRTRILREGGSPLLRIHEPGKTRSWEDGWALDDGRVAGTYVHGVMDSPGFRGDVLNRIRRAKGLKERSPGPGRLARFHQYDRLADHVEAHCNVDAILSHL